MGSESDSDASPSRRARKRPHLSSDSDLSPPRRPRVYVHPEDDLRNIKNTVLPKTYRGESRSGERSFELDGTDMEKESAGKEQVQLARYRDDRELNEVLRKRSRWGDPMEGLLRKKKEKVKVKGRAYQGPPATPNRFGIQPGPRWDGVDRSNGFEARLFQMRMDRSLEKRKEEAMEVFGL